MPDLGAGAEGFLQRENVTTYLLTYLLTYILSGIYNHHRAFMHFIFAAEAGCKESLDVVKKGFMKGVVTKDGYANTLRAYQERYNEMKSDDRNKFAEALRQREEGM